MSSTKRQPLCPYLHALMKCGAISSQAIVSRGYGTFPHQIATQAPVNTIHSSILVTWNTTYGHMIMMRRDNVFCEAIHYMINYLKYTFYRKNVSYRIKSYKTPLFLSLIIINRRKCWIGRCALKVCFTMFYSVLVRCCDVAHFSRSIVLLLINCLLKTLMKANNNEFLKL